MATILRFHWVGWVCSALLVSANTTTVFAIDCNANSVEDANDIAVGTSADCNLNGIPDECDLETGSSEDCNSNGVPDECELDEGDSNGNGIPDDCDPSEFAPQQLLVQFKPHVSNGSVNALIGANGCVIGSIISFVNEDLNGNGALDFGEDADNDGQLD